MQENLSKTYNLTTEMLLKIKDKYKFRNKEKKYPEFYDLWIERLKK
jgi:ribosomal protein L20